LRFKKESRRATNASKITIDEKETKNDAREARKTKIETRRTKIDTKVDAKIDAKATTIIATTTTTTTNKKQLSKLRKQFVCTHVNLVLEIASILSNCL